MNRHVRTVASLLPIISLALLLAGCPKRPAMTAATAPPPLPPAAAAPPRRPHRSGPAPSRRPSGAPTAATAPAPAPTAPHGVTSNAALKQIFFASTRGHRRRRPEPRGQRGYLKPTLTSSCDRGACDERGTSEYTCLGERRAKAAEPPRLHGRGLPITHDLLRQGATIRHRKNEARGRKPK